jgi:hypothetical protein
MVEVGPNSLGNGFAFVPVTINGVSYVMFVTAHEGFLELLANVAGGVGLVADVVSVTAAGVSIFCGGCGLPLAGAAGGVGVGADIVEAGALYLHDGNEKNLLARGGILALSSLGGAAAKATGDALITSMSGFALDGTTSIMMNNVGWEPGAQVNPTAAAGVYRTGDGGEMGTFVLVRIG